MSVLHSKHYKNHSRGTGVKHYISHLGQIFLTGKVTKPVVAIAPILSLTLYSINSQAADIFVAKDGNNQHEGTISQPISSIQTALNKAQPDDTQWVTKNLLIENYSYIK